jgi:hypothetical protein
MPTVIAGQQTQQNPIRFKNLVREAEGRLRERGMNEHDAESFLQAAVRSLDNMDFWQHQSAGLVVFIAENQCHEYRLPIEFHEQVVVQDRFYIKPLLPALTEGERYYILALSQNHVRLFDCDRHSAREVELKNTPQSLVDALGHELTSPGMAYQSATRPSRENAGPPDHRGQVASADEEDFKAEIQQFFRELNRGLKDQLRAGQPLVLAGVEYLLPIFRLENKHEPIIGEITGNFDIERPETLQERAWEIIEPYFTQARQNALDRYAELSGTSRAANGLEEITLAAIEGRVDTLFIARDAQRWGKFDAQLHAVRVHEQPETADEELLDLAAANTFLKDGQVFVLPTEQIPGGKSQAAILRY